MNNKCELCGNDEFKSAKNSILQSRYVFMSEFELKYCSRCGTKYLFCSCGNQLSIVHLALDRFDLIEDCPKCKKSFPELKKWIQQQPSQK